MSEETTARLLSLSAKKKLAFALLLYERMIPELRSFAVAESLDFSCFQRAREEFWRSLTNDVPSISWAQLREDILAATPDSEDCGSLAAAFALNAALVAADIAGFLDNAQESHLIEAIGYARESLDTNAAHEMGVVVYDRMVEDYVKAHPLVQRERRVEEEDVSFLSSIQDPPWPEDICSMLQHRAEAQRSLLDNAYL